MGTLCIKIEYTEDRWKIFEQESQKIWEISQHEKIRESETAHSILPSLKQTGRIERC
jgi:hypothetical protein